MPRGRVPKAVVDVVIPLPQFRLLCMIAEKLGVGPEELIEHSVYELIIRYLLTLTGKPNRV
jgi:hypothetical protein